MSPQMLGEILYAKYRTASNEKNVRGQALPEYHELTEENKKAWVAAAEAVRNPKLSDLGDRKLADAFGRLRMALNDPALSVADGDTIEIALIDHAIDRLAGDSVKRGGVAA